MGAHCIGCSSSIGKKPHYQIQPPDTCEFHPQKLNFRLQKLKFVSQIDNVQLINYPYDSVSISFSVPQFYDCKLPYQKNLKNKKAAQEDIMPTNKIKWRFEDHFCLMMDEYEIRKSFIKVSIFKQQSTPLLQLKLNLYLVITGPYHHDLALNFTNQNISRILFDLKISQHFQLLISPLDIFIQLNKQYPGEQFNYSFNAYSCSQKIVTSEGSIPKKASIYSNVQGNYRQLKAQDQCQSPTRIRKGKDLNKMIKNQMLSELHWIKKENLPIRQIFQPAADIIEQQLIMPSFRLKLKSNQIAKSSLQFILWKIQYNQSLQNNQAILFADSYFLFQRLFDSDFLNFQQIQTSQQQYNYDSKKCKKRLENRISTIQQNLIKDGKVIGKAFLKFQIFNQIHFKQLPLHARTEDGVIYMNAMFRSYGGKNTMDYQNQSISKIQFTFLKIVNSLYNLNNLSKQKKKNWTQCNKLEFNLVEQFNTLHQILTHSLEQSLMIGRKSFAQQMIEKQNTLLNIIYKIYFFLIQQDARFVPQFWKILLALFKRGQFYLQNIGFAQMQRHSSSSVNLQKNNQSSQPSTSIILPKKMSIALRYQQIIYKVLIISLDLNYQCQRDMIIQAQAFKAYGYFRIPKFRQMVLKFIVIPEINNCAQQIQILQNERKVTSAMLKIQQRISAHLDWQKYFYNYLKKQKKAQQLDEFLGQNLQRKKWFQSIKQRKQNFFIFIEYFSKKMAQLGKRLKLFRYSLCPGYNKLVKSFLIQMKNRQLTQFEYNMIQTSTVLLANHNLINIVIPIVVQKTNLYDSASINQFLNIFSTYMKYLSDNGTKMISQKFNHIYFFKIIKIILESQYSYAIAKMLVILHTYFECFNDQFKDNLSLYLLSKAFFRLFFHWSFNIRIIFYHLFIIKIYWSKLNGVTQKCNRMDTYHNENSQIYDRYKKLIRILNTAQRQKSTKKRTMKKCQKQQYYLKMKRKILHKRKENLFNSQQIQKGKQSQSGVDSSSQHENQAERNLNLVRLQALSQLKDGYNRSQTLCSTQIKEHLRHLKSEPEASTCNLSESQCPQRKFSFHERQNDKEIDRFGINLKIDKKRISKQMKNSDTDICVKDQIQKLNEQYIKLLAINSHKSSSTQQKPLVYTFFGSDDYQLQEISLNEESKILMGMEQFRQTQQFVEKYILQKGVAPHVSLDPEIQIDGNQFKPLQTATL